MNHLTDQKPTDNQCQQSDAEIKELRTALINVDAFSQSAFSEIASIANLALLCLETPEGYRRMDDIANALVTIRNKANETENCINSQAEQVGCNYVDEVRQRRWDAERMAQAIQAGLAVKTKIYSNGSIRISPDGKNWHWLDTKSGANNE